MVQRQIKKQVFGQAHVVRIDSGPGWRGILEDEINEVLTSPLQTYKFVPEVRTDDEGLVVHNIDFRQFLELPLRLLTASEILLQLDTKHVGSFGEFESFIQSIPWEIYLPAGASVKVRCQSYRSALYHEGKLDKMVLGVLHKKGFVTGGIPYYIRIEQKENRCTAFLSINQEPMFRRKYKTDLSHPASIQEHLAAAAIRWVWGKDPVDLIYAPFAGSGTMVMESWLYAHKPPLDLWRPFPQLQAMPDFPESTWNFIRGKLAKSEVQATPARAVEWDNKGIEALRTNLDYASLAWPALKSAWEAIAEDFLGDTCPPQFKNIFLPLNPPYGLRLEENTEELYARLGQWLHTGFQKDQRRFGFVLLADSKAFHAFEKGVGPQHMNGIQSFTQGGQHIRCVSFDIAAIP
ncbi:MAG: hypothetical protein H7249_14020 [Chitinophagaceae bacterium]|nr:hypothetical protein [Oligoflexus sp.]